jgi:hypothetical protein
MNATQIGRKISPAYEVGDRVQVQHKDQFKPGRISSIHHVNDGDEYVVRTDPHDGGMGEVLNIRATLGTSSFLTTLRGAR